MTIPEKAHIIAVAKLCGVTLPDDLILKKYGEYFAEAQQALTADCKEPVAEIFKRPF